MFFFLLIVFFDIFTQKIELKFREYFIDDIVAEKKTPDRDTDRVCHKSIVFFIFHFRLTIVKEFKVFLFILFLTYVSIRSIVFVSQKL